MIVIFHASIFYRLHSTEVSVTAVSVLQAASALHLLCCFQQGVSAWEVAGFRV